MWLLLINLGRGTSSDMMWFKGDCQLDPWSNLGSCSALLLVTAACGMWPSSSRWGMRSHSQSRALLQVLHVLCSAHAIIRAEAVRTLQVACASALSPHGALHRVGRRALGPRLIWAAPKQWFGHSIPVWRFLPASVDSACFRCFSWALWCISKNISKVKYFFHGWSPLKTQAYYFNSILILLWNFMILWYQTNTLTWPMCQSQVYNIT